MKFILELDLEVGSITPAKQNEEKATKVAKINIFFSKILLILKREKKYDKKPPKYANN